MDWLLNILSQGSDALGGNLLRSIPRLIVSVSTFAIAVAAISFLWRRRDLPPVYRRVALSLILLPFGISISYLIAAVMSETRRRRLLIDSMMRVASCTCSAPVRFAVRWEGTSASVCPWARAASVNRPRAKKSSSRWLRIPAIWRR